MSTNQHQKSAGCMERLPFGREIGKSKIGSGGASSWLDWLGHEPDTLLIVVDCLVYTFLKGTRRGISADWLPGWDLSWDYLLWEVGVIV